MVFWHRMIQVLYCLLLFFVPLVWLSNTSELFEFNKLIATYVFTALITGAWVCRMLAEKRFIFKKTPLDIPLGLFLLANFISLLFSIDPYISWLGYYSRWNGGLLSLLCYAGLYWGWVSHMDHKATMWAIKSALVSVVVVCVYGTLEHFGVSPSCILVTGKADVACWVQDVQTRVFATLGQPNWLASYLVSLIFIPLGLVNIEKAKKAIQAVTLRNILYLGTYLLGLVTVIFTKSRSGLLAMTAASIIFWVLVLLKQSARNLKLGLMATAVNSLVVICLVLLIPNPISDLVKKTNTPATTKQASGTQLEIGGTESGNIRKIVWTGAIRIWQSSVKTMVLGTGPETFALAYYQQRPVEHNLTSEWELLYNKAHNEFLNYLATTGLLGLLSYLLLLASMSWLLLKGLLAKGPKDSMHPILHIGLFAGWLTLPITNFWGFSVVVTQLALFLLPAMNQTLDREPEIIQGSELSKSQILALGVTIFITGCLLFTVGKYWLADVRYAQGQNANRNFAATQDSSYLITAYQKFTQAFSSFPREANYASELGNSAAYLSLALKTTSATSAAQLADLAHSASTKALELSPMHPNFYKAYARTGIILSEIDPDFLQDAYDTLQRAEKISPTDPRIPYNLGVLAQYLNQPKEAQNYFEKALQLKPDFGDPKSALDEMLQ